MTAVASTSARAGSTDVLRVPLPGGMVVHRLPKQLSGTTFDDILRDDTGWLVLDLRAVQLPVEHYADALGRALADAGRPPERTCAVHAERNVLSDMACFTSVADARQARVLSDSGYGTGWQPVPRTRA